MNLLKNEYEAVVALLSRVEVKGIQEAQALIHLVTKIKAKVENWVEPPPTTPTLVEAPLPISVPTAPTEAM